MRLIVVNAKGGQATGIPLAAWLHGLKPRWSPLVACISEADGPKAHQDKIRTALAARIPKATYHQGSETHGAREVAVLVWGRIKVVGWKSYQLTEGSGWSGAGQDRWATVVRTRYRRRRIAFVSTHASTDDPPDIQPELRRIVNGLRAGGYRVVVGGDLNEVDHPGSSWRKWAGRFKLDPYSTRVMWALVGNRLHVGAVEALHVTPDISDHPTALSVRVRP